MLKSTSKEKTIAPSQITVPAGGCADEPGHNFFPNSAVERGTTDIMESPDNWRALQNDVGKILRQCGFKVQIERTIRTVRGKVIVDVYAEDPVQSPKSVFLCECKNWKKKVPKTVVHSFRTVVSDYGANWGMIISSAGFQAGAVAAAKKSNILLLDWHGFNSMFRDRWIDTYMYPQIRHAAEAVSDYTEPINSRIFRKADALPPEAYQKFLQLRKKHFALAALALPFFAPRNFLHWGVDLPLNSPTHLAKNPDVARVPAGLLKANKLAVYTRRICRLAQQAAMEFDVVFGERA